MLRYVLWFSHVFSSCAESLVREDVLAMEACTLNYRVAQGPQQNCKCVHHARGCVVGTFLDMTRAL